jgi:hypothetical protein
VSDTSPRDKAALLWNAKKGAGRTPRFWALLMVWAVYLAIRVAIALLRRPS